MTGTILSSDLGWPHVPDDPQQPVPPPDHAPPDDADAAAEAASDAAAEFARHVALEAFRIRVREAARAVVDAENGPPQRPFDHGLLADVRARPPQPPYRIDRLVPSDASTIVVAIRKAGKTTLAGNLARSLTAGEDFLGRFPVRPVRGRVALLNFEVSSHQIARWATDMQIPGDRLYLVNLRGYRNPLTHREDRRRLAEILRQQETESLIVDPFASAYTGHNQNDPGEVAAWLADLDRFARDEVGAADLVLTVHTGWVGERSRGASSLEGWPDAMLYLTVDDEHTRYFRADGRDVDVAEDALTYDPRTRRLSMAGTGSRRDTATIRRLEALAPFVLDLLADDAALSGNRIDTELRAVDLPHSKGDGAKVAQLLERRSLVKSEPGPRGARLFSRLTYPPKTSPPSLPPSSPQGNLFDLPDPLSIERGGSKGEDKERETADLPGVGNCGRDVTPTTVTPGASGIGGAT